MYMCLYLPVYIYIYIYTKISVHIADLHIYMYANCRPYFVRLKQLEICSTCHLKQDRTTSKLKAQPRMHP